MILAQHSVVTSVEKHKLWNALSDIHTWPAWDTQLAYIRLNGHQKRVEAGAQGVLKPKKGPQTTIVITRVVPLQSVEMEAKFPLARLVFVQKLDEIAGATRVMQTVSMKGPLGWFFGLMLRRGIRKNLPEIVDNFVTYARKR